MQSVSSKAVADVLSYSTAEQLTGGKWIDGKPIYKKYIWVGNIQAGNNVSISLPNIYIIDLYGMQGANGTCIPIPFVDVIATYSTSWYYSNNTLVIFTGADRAVVNAWVCIEYTKTI